ncbi:MAG: hypothetical protein QM784_22305 [Polyangiaceae bacterium]
MEGRSKPALATGIHRERMSASSPGADGLARLDTADEAPLVRFAERVLTATTIEGLRAQTALYD